MSALAPLSDADQAVVATIAASGADGLSLEDLCQALGTPGRRGPVAAFVQGVRKRGHAVQARFVGKIARVDVYRYVLPREAPSAEAVTAERRGSDLAAVTRRMPGGAPVSVARVSFLDGTAGGGA